MDAVSIMTALDMKLAASSGDLMEALSRTATSAQLAGMSIEEASSAVGVIKDVTQKSASSIGESLKSLLARYGNVKAGSFINLETGETDQALNDTEKVLNAIGISIRSSTMEFRDFSDVLDDLAEKWVSLSTVEKRGVATSLAGTRQQENFLALMENYDAYKEAVETASDAEGTAEEKFEAYSDSIEAALNRLKDAWDELAQKFEASGFFKGLVNTATFLVEQLPRILKLVATLFATMNAYKMPGWISQLADSFNPAKAVSTGRYKGARSILTTGGWQDRKNIRDYERYKERGDLDKAKALESQLPQAYKDTFVIPEDSDENAPMVKEQKTTNQKLDDIVQDVATIAGKAKAAPVSDAQTSIAEGYNGTATGSAIIEGVNDGIDPDPVRKARRELADLQAREKLTTSTLGGLTSRQNERLMQNKAYGAQLNVLPEGGDEALAVVEKQNALQAKIHEKAELIKQTEQERLALVDQIAAKQREIDALLEKQKATQVEQNVVSQSEATTSLKIQATEAAISAEEQKQLAAQNQKNMAEAQELATDQAIAQVETNITTQDATQATLESVGNMTGGAGGTGFNNLSTVPGKQMPQNNGKAINAKPSAMQKAGGFLNKLSGGFKVGALSGVMGGLTSGITAFATQEGDAEDKIAAGVINGATTGLLSAIPGIGPILGATLGPILGDFFTEGFLKLVHAEEIARQERVEEAQKHLEELSKTQTEIENISSLVKDSENWTAEDYEAMNKSLSNITTLLREDGELREAFLEDFRELKEEYEDAGLGEALDVLISGTQEEKDAVVRLLQQNQAQQVMDETLAAQEEERYQAQKGFEDKYEEILTKGSTGQTEDWVRQGYLDFSAELGAVGGGSKYDRWNEQMLPGLQEAISNGAAIGAIDDFVDFSNREVGFSIQAVGATDEEKLESLQVAADYFEKTLLDMEENKEDYNSTIYGIFHDEYEQALDLTKQQISAYEELIDETKALNYAMHASELEYGYWASEISAWDGVDIANSTLEEVVQLFADNLTLSGVAVRDYTGAVTEEGRKLIEGYLKENEAFSSLFNNGTLTLQEMVRNQSKLSSFVGRATGSGSSLSAEQTLSGFAEIKEAFSTRDADAMKEFAKAYYGLGDKATNDEVERAVNNLQNLVYKMDPDNLDKFARALNMTASEVAGLADIIGFATLTDLVASPSEIRDSFSEYLEIFEDFAEDGVLAGENLEKIISKYPTLLNKYTEAGELVSTSMDNLYENLQNRVFGADGNNGFSFLYANALWGDIKESEEYYKGFIETLTEEQLAALDETQKKRLDNAKNLNEVMDIVNSAALSDTLIEYLNGLNLGYEAFTELGEKLSEYQQKVNEKEIKALEARIEALDKINEARETELKLIKAKDALENAQNEKKLVWREGVGWTYEVDQNAVQEAREEVESLETEREKEDLQYQIDQIQKTNDLLEGIDENINMQELENLYTQYFGEGSGLSGNLLSIIDLLTGIGVALDFTEPVENTGEQAVRDQTQAEKDMLEAKAELEEISKQIKEKANSRDPHDESFYSDYNALIDKQNAARDKFTEAKETYTAAGGDMSSVVGDNGEEVDLSDFNINTSEYANDYQAVKYLLKEVEKNGNVKDEKEFVLKEQEYYTTEEINNAIAAAKSGEGGTQAKRWNNVNDSWDSLGRDTDYAALPEGTIISLSSDQGSSGSDGFVYYAQKAAGDRWEKIEALAKGAISTPKDMLALVNEGYAGGTEAIITPQGTLTALPSKTGVVPAELTKNLYSLGEVAPNLIQELGSLKLQSYEGERGGNNTDNSVKIQNLYATFQAEENFDFESFLSDVRGVIDITRHN